jgi:thioredoxin 1
MKEWTEQQIDSKLAAGHSLCLYLYTPLCGTCQLAKKMLTVVEHLMPTLEIGMSDLNYLPDKAVEWKIESVPCLLLIINGEIQKKIYAFHSVEYLYETLKEVYSHCR